MREPTFWHHPGPISAILSPLGLVTRFLTSRRVKRRGWSAPVPVICIGNATVGGTGKTQVVLDLTARLAARGMNVHCLSRGHGGSAARARKVDPENDGAAAVGDEALLLAAVAPTWVGADRATSAQAAVAAGAEILLLDDGLQNPTLAKTASLLIIDGTSGFGNGHLLPAGPLRERVRDAAARCRGAIIIGPDRFASARQLPESLPVLHAELRPGLDMLMYAGQHVFAFAGIGRPQKFFATLLDARVHVDASRAFADHHVYSPGDLGALHRAAGGLPLVTTWKDYVRLPPRDRAGITPLAARLHWTDETRLEALLSEFLK